MPMKSYKMKEIWSVFWYERKEESFYGLSEQWGEYLTKRVVYSSSEQQSLQENGIFSNVYLKGGEAHRPIAWMRWGGTPFSASDVAPPAHIDWPPMSFLKKKFMRLMKKEREGREPSARSQRSGRSGNRRSRDFKYVLKKDSGSIGPRWCCTMIILPSKNLSALWLGRKNR